MVEKQTQEKNGLARLFSLAGQERGKLVAACTLAVLSAAAKLAPYFTIYGIVVLLLESYLSPVSIDFSAIARLAAITFAAAVVYGVCAYASSAIAHTAAYDVIYELRIRLLEKLGKLPAGYFTATTQGSLKKILSDDTEQLEAFIAHHLCDISAAIATPLFTLAYLFVMDWRLALVTLLPIVISLALLFACLAIPGKAALQTEMHDAQEAMHATIVEYIHGMPVVKIFNRDLGAFARYENDLNSFVRAVTKTAHANAWPMAAYYALFGAQLLFLLPASIFLISQAASYIDYLPIVLLFLLVGNGLKAPMEDMMQMVILSGRIVEGMKRIDAILEEPEILAGGAPAPDSFDVKFDRVSFAYDNDAPCAVDDVSCTLPQGTITGLVGPSGGGKSTLAQLLLHFYEARSGAVRIGGTDIREFSHETLTHLVSYVFQDSFVFHDTVENNIRMGDTRASFEQVERAARAAGIHDRIEELPQGYQTVIGGDGSYLSGGEAQRLGIARVFLRDTPIVVLDEATAYADAENEARIQEAFAQLAQGKTALIIAHRLKTIENADQIIVLDEGALVACDTHRELLKTCSLYRRMVDANERRDRWTVKRREAV